MQMTKYSHVGWDKTAANFAKGISVGIRLLEDGLKSSSLSSRFLVIAPRRSQPIRCPPYRGPRADQSLDRMMSTLAPSNRFIGRSELARCLPPRQTSWTVKKAKFINVTASYGRYPNRGNVSRFAGAVGFTHIPQKSSVFESMIAQPDTCPVDYEHVRPPGRIGGLT